MLNLSDDKYKTNYESLQFYYIGGRWGYAIMRLVDSKKDVKIRLAKCKKNDEFPQSKKYEWTEIPIEHVNNLSQVQKINFKPTDQFPILAKKIEEELAKIDTSKKSEENKEDE